MEGDRHMDWKTLLAYITGSVDQELLLRNEYLVTENRLLRNQIKGRVRLSDGERKALAEIGQKLGKQALEDVAKIVTPDTILAWHRKLDVHFVNPLPVSLSSATVYNGSHANVVVDTSLRLIRSWTMPAPLAPHVILAREEQSRLEAIARAPSTPQALAFRCQVILRTAAPAHPSNLQVAQELHGNRHTVGRWRSRYLAQGLFGPAVSQTGRFRFGPHV